MKNDTEFDKAYDDIMEVVNLNSHTPIQQYYLEVNWTVKKISPKRKVLSW